MKASKLTTVSAILAASSISLAVPFTIPNSHGFPNPDPAQLHQIELAADGLVSVTNTGTPRFSATDLTQFQLIAVNEFFETAFFSSLLHNVTNNVTGYEYDKKEELVAILEDILAQEELHALSAIEPLKHARAFVPSPCRYEFGSTTLQHAINFAQVFTTIVIGTFQSAAVTWAKHGAADQVRTLGAVIANEAEQNGYFRHVLGKKPSAHPFPTTSTPSFLYSALDLFTVPGSCSYPASEIDVPLFRPFNLMGDGNVGQKDQTLRFETDLGGVKAAQPFIGKANDDCGLFVTYVTAQLAPISVPATNLRWNGTVLTVEAHFPYSRYLMTGLSLAALTTREGFATVDEVGKDTLAAPAVMQADRFLNANNSLGALE